MDRLTKEGEARVIGMQGHLWGETLRSRERVEYLLMPRLVAVAERAWTKDPNWPAISDPEARSHRMNRDWNEFANRLGQRELPRLDALGVGYRIPVPGAIVDDDLLRANISTPGLTLRYSLDGTDPTSASPSYHAPVRIPFGATARVAAFAATGRTSRCAEAGGGRT